VLAITENAAEVIQSIVGSSPEEVPGEPGLRIAARPEGEQRTALELTIAAIPAEDDEVVDARNENGRWQAERVIDVENEGL
jgi:Fe-S cluster assembly iron-binding protein IscA